MRIKLKKNNKKTKNLIEWWIESQKNFNKSATFINRKKNED
jgi:hypothetical protein